MLADATENLSAAHAFSYDPMSSTGSPHSIGPYILKGMIGEGASSMVRLAILAGTNTYYACKIVPKSQLSLRNLDARFDCEIRVAQLLHHAGVVQLVDLLQDDANYYVLMEFCPGGELFETILEKHHLSEPEGQILIRHILEALRHLHQIGICHRDLKPENILLDANGFPKLSDFGLSRFVADDGLVTTPCGSPCYASPECISGLVYDGRKSDIWSVGVIMYAMLTGQLPWTKRNQQQLFEQIRKGDFSIPGYLSDPCRHLIQSLMTVDVGLRISIDAALAHPWLSHVLLAGSPNLDCPNPSLRHIDHYFGRETSAESLIEAADVDAYDLSLSARFRPDQTERLIRPIFRIGPQHRRFRLPPVDRTTQPGEFSFG
jgi:serine/threonine protein kinase